jgi:alpha-L-rhamnosidase
MRSRIWIYGGLLLFFSLGMKAQLPDVVKTVNSNIRKTALSRAFLTPTRVVWKSDASGHYVQNESVLLKPGIGQADLNSKNRFKLVSDQTEKGGIVLDFGCEIQGGLEIVTTVANQNPAARVRVRFGESVSEVMSDVKGSKGATNDHAIRDQVVTLPWLGSIQLGQTGFRFVRIDLVDENTELDIKEISAIFTYRDIPYIGSFKCNDERLNKIWMTGAYTVHVNMQDYLWDGIKRDRLVWIGDMHPEVMTVNAVFGYNEAVPKSLDLIRDTTPLPGWISGISSYSIWWLLIQRDWYYHQGDLAYLQEQRTYLTGLLRHLITKIDKNGREQLDGNRFLDWPSSENKDGIDAGLQALMLWAMNSGRELCEVLGEKELAKECSSMAEKLKQEGEKLAKSYTKLKKEPDAPGMKQGAALMALTGLMKAEEADRQFLSVNGAHGFSTFYGYYMLRAMAEAGNYKGAMDVIREFWGAMLDLGATTFWEDFNMDWLPNASRIDELVPEGKKDIHGDYGAYCYVGLRHSLCHGWASGPTSWLSEYILGIKVLEPGCKVVQVRPNLGDLQWVEGSFPTPYGEIRVSHKKIDGKTETKISSPVEVRIVR